MVKTIAIAVALTGLLAGCSSGGKPPAGESGQKPSQEQKSDTSGGGVSGRLKGTAKDGVTDEAFPMPVYPGAKPVEMTGVVTEVGDTTTISKAWTTSDDVAKVSDFYKSEAAKAGKILTSVTAGEGNSMITTIILDIPNGQCQTFVSYDKTKKATLFSMTLAKKGSS